MGHFYSENISRIANRLIERPEGATRQEIVQQLLILGEEIHAAEGVYGDEDQLLFGVDLISDELAATGVIEPLKPTKTQAKTWKKYLKYDPDTWTDRDVKVLCSIRMRAVQPLPVINYICL